MSENLKPFTEIDEQIRILEMRSLIIKDVEDAKAKLLQHNYYTIINGYKYPFLDQNSAEEKYSEGATFDELFALYTFDCNIRALFLKYILKVEHQLKSVISHVFAKRHEGQKYPDYFLDEKNFDIDKDGKLPPKKQSRHRKLCEDISKELSKQQFKNSMIDHYLREYDNIPPWILVSIFSFGMLRSFYYCLSNRDQNEVARIFGLKPDEFDSYLTALNFFRNSCAHDERIYNKKLINRVVRKNNNGTKCEYQKVYVVVLILKDMLDASSFMSFYSAFDDCIEQLNRSLESIEIEKIFSAMGIPADKSVRKTELGPLDHGNALSDEEFKNVLQRYIVPILPINVCIRDVVATDPNKDNHSCKLVYYKDELLYFAQAVNGKFVYTVPLNGISISQDQVDDIDDHLSTLINYIHIFWNLSNLSVYGRDKVEIAFPTLCEQAYELTICNLMCKHKSRKESLKYKCEYMEYKRRLGTEDAVTRQKLAAVRRVREKEIAKIIEREGVAERTLYNILSQIETWAAKTYEGQKKTFGIVICIHELSDVPTFNYVNFLKSDYSATINDGIYSAVELFADGSFREHFTINTSTEQLPTIPYPFSGFASHCDENKIGVLLTNNGDILIINDRKLCYTKHNGNWLCSMADKVIDQIEREARLESRQQAEVIYQAIVDVSYSRGGACIGIIDSNEPPQELIDMISAGLLSKNQPEGKLLALKTMISKGAGQQKSFFELERALRRELLELDGAMVLSKNGQIHVIGTIIKLDGSGSDGGGRTAAAKQLSEHGLAVKVSQDGYVQLFKHREPILEIMT